MEQRRRPTSTSVNRRTTQAPRKSTRAGAKKRPTSSASRRPANQRPGVRRRRTVLRMPLAASQRRLNILLLAMAMVVSICAGRLFQLQGLDAQAYAAEAAKSMTRSVPIAATRGTITDRYGAVLANTAPAVMITADPTLINAEDPDKNSVQVVADLLMKHVGGDRAEFIKALTKPNTQYSIVARKVPAAAYHRFAAELSTVKVGPPGRQSTIYGVFRESDPIRIYPEKTSSAAVLGFVGSDSMGQAGIEYTMNSALAGTPGREMYEASPAGYRIPLGTNMIEPPVNGGNYQLTIDTELQVIAERKLAEAVAESGAKSGTAITIDIKTGEILALANAPTFDPNDISKANSEDLFNRAITQAYEPGSVQKVLTMAALIDAGHMTPETRLIVPPTITSGGGVVKDVWKHGYANVTARGVLAYSSNIGSIMLAREMDTAEFRQKMVDFGLGQRTGIELPGEAAGHLPSADMPGYTRDQISFGQGLSVTPVQNAAALAGILNGGMYNPPTIIRSATDAAGNPVPVERREPRRVVSPETSRGVASMMESVTGEGAFASHLAMEEYRTGGKTGTSENFNVELGRYAGFTSSYVGFGPVEDPHLLTLVVISEPTNGHTGGAVAGPVVFDVLRTALPKYGIQPSTGSRPTEDQLTW